MSVDRRKFVFAGFGAVLGATMGGAKAIASAFAPSPKSIAAARTAEFWAKWERDKAMNEAIRSLVQGTPLSDTLRQQMQRSRISADDAERELASRLRKLGPHPDHTFEHADDKQWCRECLALMRQQCADEHPHHQPSWESLHCQLCEAERSQHAIEAKQFTENHRENHEEYTPGCRDCWNDYMVGTRRHPKLGLRQEQTSKYINTESDPS